MKKIPIQWNQIFWNLWPLIRLMIAAAAFGIWIHCRFGWNPPTMARVAEYAAKLLIALWLCSFVSIGLAETILLILLFPLYAAIHLNTWFYDAGYLFFRAIVKLRSEILSAGLALMVELGLLLSLWRSAEFLLRNYIVLPLFPTRC